MRRILISSISLSLLCLAAPVHAQAAVETDGDYLQHRATALKGRIDASVGKRQLTQRKAAGLRLSVGKVQTEAGHLQAVKGTIDRPDADRMNQTLTEVERVLARQP